MIGHNIGFDHSILSRYMDLSHIQLLDTYPLAKAMMHFEQSYALDVLHQKSTKHRTLDEAQISKHDLKR